MTDLERLKRADMLLSSEAAFESDIILIRIATNEPVTKKERRLATVVSSLYKLIHPRFCASGHEDWKRDNAKFAKTREVLY